MRFWQSVRFKIVFGFFLILAPMILFLIYNNLYAARIVREQILIHYSNLMTVQVNTNDAILQETEKYLQRLEFNNDSDILSLQTLPVDDSEFTIAKLGIRNRFALATGYYNMVDTFFLYSLKDEDPVFATQYPQKYEELYTSLKDYASPLVSRKLNTENQRWEKISIPNDYQYLIKSVNLGSGLFAGAMVRIDSLNKVLGNFDVGPDGAVYIIDSAGHVKTSDALPPAQDEQFRQTVLKMKALFGTMNWDGKKYLVLTQSSVDSDLHYVIVTTESYILKNLPFFQRMLYFWIPLTAIGVLTIYLMVLQRFIFKPLVRLVRGMRKLGNGQFDVRMPIYPEGIEFAFLSSSFNQMATQIEKLKIDVYEEQIRLQRAEYKQLQIQINPHFYMNSLNIIYNLAALKDFKTVQKLSLHLADYFRFLMLGHRTVVRFGDEIRHIEHYLEIQKLRFVSKLEYEIQVSSHHLSWELSPLMLQPFVENSVIHGFNRRVQDSTPFRIFIRSDDDPDEPEQYIMISIRDNGPGYPESLLPELNSGTYESHSGEQNLGIWNIMRRFKMLYGGKGAIRFANALEGGAVVIVRLPREKVQSLDSGGEAALQL